MSASTLKNTDSLRSLTGPAQPTHLSLSASAVHIRKNGIEFRSGHPIPLWTEMTVDLQTPLDPKKFRCTGVINESSLIASIQCSRRALNHGWLSWFFNEKCFYHAADNEPSARPIWLAAVVVLGDRSSGAGERQCCCRWEIDRQGQLAGWSGDGVGSRWRVSDGDESGAARGVFARTSAGGRRTQIQRRSAAAQGPTRCRCEMG